MPEEQVVERARHDKEEGKSPSAQAGEFVREEMHHIREGKHGVQSPQQAIAIGLSKARRAGVKLPPPKKAGSRRRHARKPPVIPGKGGARKHASHRLCDRVPSRRRSSVRAGPRHRAGAFRATLRPPPRVRGRRSRQRSARRAARTRAKR
jgi:hypothetical protein